MKSALEAIRARALERLQNAEDLTALEEARGQPKRHGAAFAGRRRSFRDPREISR